MTRVQVVQAPPDLCRFTEGAFTSLVGHPMDLRLSLIHI